MRASSAFLSCVCAALVLASCTKTKTEPRTEILIRVDAGALVRGMADHLRVELSSGAGEEKLVEVDPELFDVSRASFHWPASLALVAKPSHASYAFEVSATAEKDGKALARARVRSKFIGGKTLLLDVVLQDVCIGRLDCASDETCVADGDQAKCVPATVKPETLHELKPGTDAGGEALPGNQDAATGDGGGNSDSGSGNTGKEDCWNGSDDDDDGDIDCADSDCKPVAVCVPEGDRVGALVPKSSACPAHFDGTKTLLHQGLQDDGCTGCSCTADTNCVSDVFYFPDDASCTSATFPYGAAYYIGTVGIAVCDAQHLTMNPLTTNFASPAGWAAGKFRATDSCQAMGTAEPVVPSWSKSDNFCETSLLGGGCDSGEVCVPKPAGVPVCASRNGGGSCGGSTAADTWYTGFDDKRTCDACACDTSGSDCTSLTLKMGHDYGCGTTDSTLGSEEKACMISTYDPPVYLDGTFTAAKCSAHADATGSLDPTGRLNLCCVQ